MTKTCLFLWFLGFVQFNFFPIFYAIWNISHSIDQFWMVFRQKCQLSLKFDEENVSRCDDFRFLAVDFFVFSLIFFDFDIGIFKTLTTQTIVCVRMNSWEFFLWFSKLFSVTIVPNGLCQYGRWKRSMNVTVPNMSGEKVWIQYNEIFLHLVEYKNKSAEKFPKKIGIQTTFLV